MSSFKIFLNTFVISGWCLALFVGLGYYYIDSQNVNVENEVEKVPYNQLPENKGVLLTFGTKGVYTYLDFEMSCVRVVINPENLESLGYSTDYVIDANYKLIADICDYFGGINLTLNAETLRYTGGQIVDMLSTDISNELRIKVISSIFQKMSQQGVGADFFNLLITQSQTELKMPDCYFWTDFMDEIASEVSFL